MARQILRLVGTRYGIALVLAVVVIGAIAITRAVSGSAPISTTAPPVRPPSATTIAPAEAELGDDSVATSENPGNPTTVPGRPGPETVALEFARAWVRTTGVTSEQWLNGLKPHATVGLIERMRGADPVTVPADDVRGDPKIRVRDSELVEVDIPVSPGLLRLRLIWLNDQWLVDSVSWDRP